MNEWDVSFFFRDRVKRLLVRLANEGQIKNIRTILRCGDRERALIELGEGSAPGFRAAELL